MVILKGGTNLKKEVLYAPNLKQAAKAVSRAIKGFKGVSYHLTLQSYWEADTVHSPKQWEVLHVDLWFFGHFRKNIQAGGNLDRLEEEVRRTMTETMEAMREHFAPEGGQDARTQ